MRWSRWAYAVLSCFERLKKARRERERETGEKTKNLPICTKAGRDKLRRERDSEKRRVRWREPVDTATREETEKFVTVTGSHTQLTSSISLIVSLLKKATLKRERAFSLRLFPVGWPSPEVAVTSRHQRRRSSETRECCATWSRRGHLHCQWSRRPWGLEVVRRPTIPAGSPYCRHYTYQSQRMVMIKRERRMDS